MTLDPDFIIFTIGVLGTIFTVYNYFRNPQEAIEKKQALSEQELDNTAQVLTQKLQWEKEENERRFRELGEKITGAMTLAQNHIHTVDVKVDTLNASVNTMAVKVAELSTIINERIPKK